MYNAKKQETHLKIVDKDINPFTQKEIQEKVQLGSEFIEYVEELIKKEIPFEAKMRIILKMQGQTVPLLIEELKSRDPNVNVGIIAGKLGTFLKEMRDTLIKEREVETSNEINPYSPKFQFIFESFVELVHAVMVDQKINEIEITNFFNAFAGEIAGWEEVIIKKVKGITSKTLCKISNPFMEKFKDRIKYVRKCKKAQENMYYI